MIRAALLLALLAGPVAAQEQLPDGYPPVMGDVTAKFDGHPIAWQTYDFSVGAFDASAWITDDDATGAVTLRIMAYAPGKPEKMEDRLRIVADLPAVPKAGDTPPTVLVEVLGVPDIDGRKMTSGHLPVLFVIDSFSRDSYAYGRVAGHFEAVICLKRNERSDISNQCKSLTGRFDTALQFDSMGEF